MTVQEIAEEIKKGTKTSTSILIGIEGYGGSGKSTFAEQLKNALGHAYVISMDNFIVKEKLTEQSWDKGAFDRERLEKQVLTPASVGGPISYQRLIWGTNSLSEPNNVSDTTYIIIEGISSYHPSIAHYYDYKIWVDTPIEIAKQRGHARDGSNENAEHWDLWAENDLVYQQKHHPEKVADFIFDTMNL